MNVSALFLFFFQILIIIGILGIILSRTSLLIILMCLEMVLLGANLSFTFLSAFLNDIKGALATLFIMAITAAESSIGLALLVAYYRIRGIIYLQESKLLRG